MKSTLRIILAIIGFSGLVASKGYASCTNATNGTPQTATTLTQTEFPNSPSTAGQFLAGCMRDIIASTYGSANNNINLKNLGLPTGGDDTTAINNALASLLPASFTGTGSIANNLVVATNAQTVTGTTPTVLHFASTSGMVTGLLITGTNIPANTYINSIVTNSSVTMSNAVTGTVTNGQSITFALVGNSGSNGAAILTVTGTPGGTIALDQTISGTGITPGTRVLAFLTGSGGAGTYFVTIPPASAVSSETITFQPPATGYVYAPAGVYQHAHEIISNGVCLIGDGPEDTVFRSTDTTGNDQGIQIYGVDPCLKNIAITSTWNGSRQSNGTSQAIYVNQAAGFLIQNVWCIGGAAGCMLNYGGTNGRVINNRAINTLADAFHNTNTAHDVLVLGNYAFSPGDDCFPVIGYTTDVTVPYNIRVEGNTCVNGGARGMVVDGGNNIVFVGNIISAPYTGVCIYAAGDAGYLQTKNISFIGNTCTSQTTFSNYPVMIFGQSGAITSGILVDGNQMIGTPSACMLLGQGSMFATDLTITNNHCVGATGNTNLGIALNGISNTTITGNTIEGYATGITNIAAIDSGYLKIGDNHFTRLNPTASGTQAAIWIDTDAFSGLDIHDNTQVNAGTTITYCVIVNAITEVTISGNHCDQHANSVSSVTAGYYNNVYGASAVYGPQVGTFTCASSAATVSNTGVTATSKISITLKTVGGTVANPFVNTITAGTGFHVTCGASDTSTYNYIITN